MYLAAAVAAICLVCMLSLISCCCRDTNTAVSLAVALIDAVLCLVCILFVAVV